MIVKYADMKEVFGRENLFNFSNLEKYYNWLCLNFYAPAIEGGAVKLKFWKDSKKKTKPTKNAVRLVIGALFQNCMIDSNELSRFESEIAGNSSSRNCQARHLSFQMGYNWKIARETTSSGEVVKRGFYYVENGGISPRYIYGRRNSKISASNFEEMKKNDKHKCRCCGHTEGNISPWDNKRIVLQMGHINPRLDATIDNIMPQCEHCNNIYRNKPVYAIYNKDGHVIKTIAK